MPQQDPLADVEEYLNTTISSPTNGWFEVFRNEAPNVDADLHLEAVEYLPPDRYVTANELIEIEDIEEIQQYADGSVSASGGDLTPGECQRARARFEEGHSKAEIADLYPIDQRQLTPHLLGLCNCDTNRGGSR